MATSRKDVSFAENGVGEMLSSRTERPLFMFEGFAQGLGDKDYISGNEVVSSTNTKLPYVEKLPPYTTWIFLDRYDGVIPLHLGIYFLVLFLKNIFFFFFNFSL